MATYTDITINQDTGIGSGKIDGILFSSVNLAEGSFPVSQPKVAPVNSIFDPSGNQTNKALIINAVDIDWNGAKPDIGETSDGITTTGELLKLIKNYADKKLDSVPVATSSVYGGFKLGFPQLDNNYPVQLDSNGKAYVNVPWTDTNTTYKAGTNIGIDPFEPINPIAQSINTSNSDISTVDAGTSHIDSSSIIGNPSVLTIYHATPENATEGQKGDTSENLLAYIKTDKQGHVTGYATITPAELWSLLRPYADALYLPKPKPIIGVTDILLNKDTLPISVNGTGEVIATISPDNATNKNITWTSSNETIATVTSHTTSGSPAIVTWKSGGNTTITATAEGDESKQKTCIILCQSPQPATTYYYAGQNAGDTYITSNNYTTIATQSEFTTKDVDMTVGNYLYVVVPSTKTVEITDPAGSFITMNFYNSSTGAYAKKQNLATDEYYLIRSRGAAAIAEKWTVKVS